MTPEKQQMIDWLRAKGACRDGHTANTIVSGLVALAPAVIIILSLAGCL